MTINEFTEWYNKDVDFRELVDYLCKTSKVYSQIVNLVEKSKFDKSNKINDVELEDVRAMFVNSQQYLFKVVNEKAAEKLRSFVEKQITKEQHGIQADVHD